MAITKKFQLIKSTWKKLTVIRYPVSEPYGREWKFSKMIAISWFKIFITLTEAIRTGDVETLEKKYRRENLKTKLLVRSKFISYNLPYGHERCGFLWVTTVPIVIQPYHNLEILKINWICMHMLNFIFKLPDSLKMSFQIHSSTVIREKKKGQEGTEPSVWYPYTWPLSSIPEQARRISKSGEGP